MSLSSLSMVKGVNAGSNRYSYTPPRSAPNEGRSKAAPENSVSDVHPSEKSVELPDVEIDPEAESLHTARNQARSIADKKNRLKDTIQADAALDLARYQILNDSKLAMLIHANIRNQSVMILTE